MAAKKGGLCFLVSGFMTRYCFASAIVLRVHGCNLQYYMCHCATARHRLYPIRPGVPAFERLLTRRWKILPEFYLAALVRFLQNVQTTSCALRGARLF